MNHCCSECNEYVSYEVGMFTLLPGLPGLLFCHLLGRRFQASLFLDGSNSSGTSGQMQLWAWLSWWYQGSVEQLTRGSILHSSAFLWSKVTSFYPCSKTSPWGFYKLKKKKKRSFFLFSQKLNGWKIQIKGQLLCPLPSGFRQPLSPILL